MLFSNLIGFEPINTSTHHIAFDLWILSLHSEYGGSYGIVISDDNSVPKSHIGSTHIHSNNKTFQSNNVLCALSTTKNFLSGFQLCKQNLTSIEFFHDFFVWKIWRRASLVQGQHNGSIYEWPNNSSQSYPTWLITTIPTLLGITNLAIHLSPLSKKIMHRHSLLISRHSSSLHFCTYVIRVIN